MGCAVRSPSGPHRRSGFRFAAGAVLGTDPAEPRAADGHRHAPGSGSVLVLGFEGVADRDAAETLRGTH